MNILCYKCNNIIATYQKDGPGNLRRMYFDRIMSPKNLTKLEKVDIKDINNLSCSSCGFELGVPYIYEKENRGAFRIFQDAIIKKVRKLKD